MTSCLGLFPYSSPPAQLARIIATPAQASCNKKKTTLLPEKADLPWSRGGEGDRQTPMTVTAKKAELIWDRL